MTEVLFYHLTESKLEDALPPLLDKSVERGWRVAVQGRDPARRDLLDSHLWTFREDSFLPHGTDAGEAPEHQPVLLTLSPENVNDAKVRFFVDGAEAEEIDVYDRVVFMFDGYDQSQLEGARAQWKKLKAEGHKLTYWQQTQEGRWEKKA
ncbi:MULTISPECIES: DNA polymerase III subunit chi [Rhizobium]|uniref:DNA polymerase III subunit chi n=1 Tax=Rhizobium rhododendri TaxID=2506430 RepID=A0ABY8IJ38_9HYPH|nr:MULTISPECIES: DNA polymerase III subunit chi [Rhizobium]MBZ5760145.1 DNA polymerase III subunit chi [Rhizobium sp. VS19-DR96]MBZ5766374.1 DNA polymerase III subunit chi [Rhizobium sp. VS19-DR129.2]MBZ5774283.1 DNA polymerase III subunit chi [Rhizobium sp. VS19-DRK62.2]MBZ5785355.1 DNA polymerase III subunit chi [Rhizobium sp. VS19-DR121]MBZ5802954.1 DNA polymerase III subunit chi [Rhizobium sp. VS19-DR181]